MARQYEGRVQVIGMPGRDSLDAMRGFVERHGLGSVPHAVDGDGKLWARLGVRYQPTWIFVNGADGEATIEFGDFDPDGLRSRFDALLGR
ncbi:MAG TPA: hypothetical protein VFO65_04440 [Acidimicrobiales bacterium]|nr:hypothetical protein [Acidimicrobiales bacterium]